MSTAYFDAVMADAPLAYYPLDRVGTAANGDEIEDISGNDYHATLCYRNASGSMEPYGRATGIETSTASRGMWTFSDNNSHVAGDLTYAWNADNDLDLDGDFTLEAWCKSLSNVASASSYAFFGKRGRFRLFRKHRGSPGAGEANFYFALSVVLTDATTYTVEAALPVFNNTYYHVVGGRTGTTIFIRINSAFLATATIPALDNAAASETALSLTPCNPPGDSLFIGGVPFNDVHNDTDLDECALYDYALGASRIEAHYQAAKLSLPLSATIKVRAAVSLDADQIIPVAFPYAHNYAKALGGQSVAIRETLDYSTLNNRSQPDYLQRIGAAPHGPERSLDYQVTLSTPNQRARYHAALFRPGQTYTVPVWTDWTELTAEGTGGASSLSLDTVKRDIEIGSYIGACSDPYDPRTYQFFKVGSRDDTSTTFSTGTIGTTLPDESPVFPARLMTLEDAQPVSHTRDRETWALTFRVLSTELSSRRVTAYTPTETYKSLERFTLSPATVEWLDEKGYQLQRRQGGGDDFQEAVDTGSARTIPVRVLLTTRDELSEFYGWLDARQGKKNGLWVVTDEKDMEVTARTATTITITAIDYTSKYNLHHARRDIEFTKVDGTYVRRRITACVNNGNGTETLTMATGVPNLADIARVSFLRYCVCTSDTFELTFHRDLSEVGAHIVECSFSFTELLFSPA
jgi:hypothetical protein